MFFFKEALQSLAHYIPSLCPMSPVPRPATSQYLDRVNSITFSDLSCPITLKISAFKFYISKLLCLSFESLSVFCFKMNSNVVNFPSEYLVCLQPDIWKTLLQGTSQIKINLSGCSMITKSFQKFGESSLKTVLWPPAIKLEFQPMCSLRPICICNSDLCLSFCFSA